MKTVILTLTIMICAAGAALPASSGKQYRYGIAKAEGVKVWVKPDTESKPIDTMRNGEVAVILGKTDPGNGIAGEKWYRVLNIHRKQGWVQEKYLHEVADDNTLENNVYRFMLYEYMQFDKILDKRWKIENYSIIIDKENKVCVLDYHLTPPKGSHLYETPGGVSLYTIDNNGKVISINIYFVGEHYHITKNEVFSWTSEYVEVYDRKRFRSFGQGVYFRSECFNEICSLGISHQLFESDKYDISKCGLTFDPITLIATKKLYPKGKKEPVIIRYKYFQKRFVEIKWYNRWFLE